MNCRIVFYSAKKTSYCEKALRKSVAGIGLNVKTAAYATDGMRLYSLSADWSSATDEA